jgi:hypothetical protein
MDKSKPKDRLRVLELSPRKDQATKPRELIQVNGHQTLTLAARRAITILWHSAHRQGIVENKSYTIELSELRPPNSRNNEPVEEAIIQLMKTIISITKTDGTIRRVQFLGGNDMQDSDRADGVLTYNFDKFLVQVLQDSQIWGKISLPVLMSFTSKYSISLYENVAQWAGLNNKTTETFSLAELRGMLGVEPDKYLVFGALNKDVLRPVLVEINALAPFNMGMLIIKTGRKVTHIRINWWEKTTSEHKAAWAEINKSKIGRKVRISQKGEFITGPATGLAYLTHENGGD